MSRFLVLASWVFGAACAPEPVVLDFEDGRLRLAVTDAALLDEVQTFVAAMFFIPAGHRCADLLELSPLELAAIKEDQVPISSAQAIPAISADGQGGSHAFGRVSAPGPYSYLLLGSRRAPTQFPPRSDGLSMADGSVIAMGCRDVEVAPGERHDIKLVLFPAGLR